MRVLCWFGWHDWWRYIRSDFVASALMPPWFICRKVCLRCGEDRVDEYAQCRWARGWRP